MKTNGLPFKPLRRRVGCIKALHSTTKTSRECLEDKIGTDYEIVKISKLKTPIFRE